MVPFSGNIFILGCGSIAQCSLPLLLKQIDIEPSRITVMDFVDNRERIKEEIKKGVRYTLQRITKENYKDILSQYLKTDDVFINLSWSVSSHAMIEWCHNRGVLYLDTAMELWEFQDSSDRNISNLTLYSRQLALRDLVQSWDKPGKTIVTDHGANPGLVSHLTKQGLVDLAHYVLKENPQSPRAKIIQQNLQEENFASLAYHLNVKTIHISEKDTQIASNHKRHNEFVNTWSVKGFIEESIAPAEIGWGTHERHFPKEGMEHEEGPRNQIYLHQKGIKTKVQSWVPSGPITGMVIRHGESFSISNHLTIWNNDKAIYRPTVHYAYCPCEDAIKSLHELEMSNFVPQTEQHILNDEIVSGKDELGCLIMGNELTSWWIGSVLSIEESRLLVPHQSATTLQVAISVVAGVIYMIKNPEKGFCQPDDLPYKEILDIAKPYLGKFISTPVKWSPSDVQNKPRKEDKWQFTTFLVPSHTS